MKQRLKRPLALLMVLAMVLGLLPASALAAEPDGQTRADNVETLDASVEYDSTARTSATITYHKEAQDAPDVNIVFLLDVSWQGSESFPQFRQMISEAGDALFDHTDAQMQMITYTQTAVLRERSGASVDSSVCTEGWELRNLLAGVGSGGGTANAAAGLKEAAKVVGDIGNGNPTIVFWVLEDSFGNVDGATGGDAEEPVREALTALKGKLDGEGDALITWQLADKPHELLADAATAISGGEVAAYAANGREEFRAGMLESLENLVHDHYRDLTVTLPLAAGQQLVEKIISAQWESESGALHELTPTVSGDGRSVTVTIDKLCQQAAGDLILEAALTDAHAQETSISQAETTVTEGGGLYTGLFELEKEEAAISFSPVTLDRREYTITYQNGSETIGSGTTAMVGQLVAIRDGSSLTNTGSSFGGWNDSEGNHYTAGQIIAMPEGGLELTAAWGHVNVVLELGDVVYTAGPSGNNMSPNARWSGEEWLNFSNITVNGEKPYNNQIHSLQVIDQSLTYEDHADSSDARRVNITTAGIDAVYARHVGATDHDGVVAYLVECTHGGETEKDYDLIIAGPGGVTAPANMSNWMSSSTIEEMDLSCLHTSQVTNMKYMFYNCQQLTTLQLGENFDTSQAQNMEYMFNVCSKLTELKMGDADFHFDTSNVTNMNSMFRGCSSMTELDLSSFNTSNVTNMGEMFAGSNKLEEVVFGDNFTAAKVQDMYRMFGGCSSLKKLDLSSFNGESAVTTMRNMFASCSQLESVTLPKPSPTCRRTPGTPRRSTPWPHWAWYPAARMETTTPTIPLPGRSSASSLWPSPMSRRTPGAISPT